MEPALRTGYKISAQITRKFAKTFYFASRLLPKPKRNAAYSVYALCRISDDAVDIPRGESTAQSLNHIEKEIASAYDNSELSDNVLIAFKETVTSYQIPRRYFDELLSGMRMDLEKTRYRNFAELYEYCYKVAGVVGLIMIKIFGYSDPEAKKHAESLGIAMQLTNILRDVREDYQRGRIYIPLEDMEKYGVSESDIASGKITENLKQLLEFQTLRARDYYSSSKAGIAMISDRQSRLVILAMNNIYSGILDDIEDNDYDVFSRRACVNSMRKIWRLTKILCKGEYR